MKKVVFKPQTPTILHSEADHYRLVVQISGYSKFGVVVKDKDEGITTYHIAWSDGETTMKYKSLTQMQQFFINAEFYQL